MARDTKTVKEKLQPTVKEKVEPTRLWQLFVIDQADQVCVTAVSDSKELIEDLQTAILECWKGTDRDGMKVCLFDSRGEMAIKATTIGEAEGEA